MQQLHRVDTEATVRLSDLSTSGKDFHSDRKAAEKEFESLRRELAEWQLKFYAAKQAKLLVVLQGMDCSGKDGTTRHVFRGVNPQGVPVVTFKQPTDEELAHDYLWRIHKQMPAAGMIAVFNRSHYEDVLVVRVDQLAPEEVWQMRFAQINEFEKLLAQTGTRILKFFLHISAKEQKQRFEERLEDPAGRWKFSMDDLKKRKQWDAYQAAYEDAIQRCNAPWAPWYIIPANQRWYRNLAVCRVIVETLREMRPEYPERPDLPESIEID
jgi:PPK2 family polyphosphate:nucleotide phosphotransferase